MQEDYGRLPLGFEANRGQTDPRVRFLARESGFTLFLTATQAVLSLKPRCVRAATLSGPSPACQAGLHGIHRAVTITLLGANHRATVTGQEPLPGKTNYLRGNDPSRWILDVATYGRVRYQDVYPGIDLSYHGDQGRLEYDFVVGPGANPDAISLDFAGVRSVALDPDGGLLLSTDDGAIRQPPPFIYQEPGGARRQVAGRYVIDGRGRIGFDLGAYDRTLPLVIDPVLAYSTYLGGSVQDRGLGIAVGTDGSAYLAGLTESADFPTTPGAFKPVGPTGSRDAFVAKLNPEGSALLYSTYLGGSGSDDLAYDVAVDVAGNVYATGQTDSSDFPTTSGAFDTTFNGDRDAFVTKLDSTGSSLVYSTYLGGTGLDAGTQVAIDGKGRALVTGPASSPDFPTTTGAFDETFNGQDDAFVTKLRPSGAGLAYSTYLGGTGIDVGRGIAVDANGNAYVSGETTSPDFPVAGGFDTTFNGGTYDAFVAKVCPSGSSLVYSSYLGGTGDDVSYGIALNSRGAAYVSGFTDSVDFPTTAGSFQAADPDPSGVDGFVTKVRLGGSGLAYSTYLGGTARDLAVGIAVDGNGRATVAGSTLSTDFPTTPGSFQATDPDPADYDALVTTLNRRGSALLFSTYLGGTGQDDSTVAIDQEGGLYVVGTTVSADFPTTTGSFQPTDPDPGGPDAFAAKFGP